MRKNGKNKKLALLVGMAMAFSAAYSVAPSDAFAANYTVTVGDEDKLSVIEDEKPVADATVETVTKALGIKDNNFTISNAALKKLTPSGNDATDASITSGNKITITDGGENATRITYTAGEKAVLDTKGALAGNYSSIDVAGGSSEATEVSLGSDATVDNFNVVSGKAELKSGTATTINVADNAELVVSSSGGSGSSNELTVDNLNVTGSGKLSGSSATIKAKNITATGENVDLSGVTLAKGSKEGDTLTITNTSGSVKLGAVGAGTTVTANGVEATTLADGAVINGGTGEVKLTDAVSGGTINADKVALGSTVSGGTITAANGVTVTGAVSGKATIDGGAGDVTLTGGITPSSDKDSAPTITGKDITVGTALTVSSGSGYANIKATGDVKLTGENSVKDLNITAGGTVDVGSTAMTNENMANITANKLKTSGTVTVSSELTGIKNIETEGAFSVNGSDALNFDSVTAGSFSNTATTSGDNTAPAVNIKSLTVNGKYTNSGTVTVDTLKLGEKATISQSGQDSGTNATINAKTIILDTTNSNLATQLGNLTINGGNGSGDDVKIVLTGVKDNADTSSITEALATAIYGKDATDDQKAKLAANTTTTSSTGSADELSKAEEGVTEAKGKMQTYSTYTADEIQTKIANADPFSTKLPSLADLQAMTSADEQKNLEALNTAQKALYESQVAAGTLSKDDAAAKIAALPKTTAEQAEKIRAAVQNAGKTAAAPAVTSMRTANVVADVATTNVVNRTAELRSFVPSAESEEKPDNLWFQYKHSKIDVDNGDTYSKSTVKTNSYQLGYDAKVSETDIVGGYVGTTTGSSEFNGPARSGSVDIKNALDLGLYGTHMMTKGQYIDYMLHRNKFDNRTMGQTYGTTDLGAMLRYGVKIAQPNGLTLDPYIQLAYDKISVDSYQAGENTISSDDSNNFSTKIGLNLITTGGLYGGVAYSRGLSGSYSAYVNGIAMPTQDNDTNVIYLNLGYRAGIARDIFLDLSLEKTFCDYDGWNAAGKINFYF